ncbi:MAG TPA: sugar phosphate nucleotidyltransferase [Candidatus Levybacteria bacterium]|nr:sugar phosphate nucleotidyltransferase [Candidatus Levybacteria bacterium]
MDDHNADTIWAVILAAGKGTRMNSQSTNKVAMKVAGVPMLVRTVQNLQQSGINNICIVVGFAKESVMNLFDNSVHFAQQGEQLGTGHAAKVGVDSLPENTTDIIVLYGDDSYIYTPDIYKKLLTIHQTQKADLSFITLTVDNPTGLGRIVRDSTGNVIGIVEEKDATDEQKKITEINPACYIFSYSFFKEYIDTVPKSPVTGEYYLTSLIEIAVQEHARIETYTVTGINWRGINTPEELQQADTLMQS